MILRYCNQSSYCFSGEGRKVCKETFIYYIFKLCFVDKYCVQDVLQTQERDSIIRPKKEHAEKGSSKTDENMSSSKISPQKVHNVKWAFMFCLCKTEFSIYLFL